MDYGTFEWLARIEAKIDYIVKEINDAKEKSEDVRKVPKINTEKRD